MWRTFRLWVSRAKESTQERIEKRNRPPAEAPRRRKIATGLQCTYRLRNSRGDLQVGLTRRVESEVGLVPVAVGGFPAGNEVEHGDGVAERVVRVLVRVVEHLKLF